MSVQGGRLCVTVGEVLGCDRTEDESGGRKVFCTP